ncbi:MAG: UDP-4-amino-4,6-dideoxy-N-acetyl-beta-L-altrosamine N-acetyltransferase [Lachnospiraceae bacterium]|nr:UDP-4-amino-4,6-dideoxy-N-acetyl-beta-L-altrosamine N-acetyltransferase [Lachnospiraceae bacterium]
MGKVLLRQLSLADTDNIVRWRNNPSVKKNLYSQDELKHQQHISYFEKLVKTGKCAQFIIVENGENQRDIGTTFIKNIDHNNHNGEYGIFIGEDSARGKGLAVSATYETLKYGFEELKLHRIYLTVMADNVPAISTYEKVGFIKEGIMRDGFLRYDGYVDIVMMAMLKSGWDNQRT